MLAPAKITEVQILLSEGRLSHRAIAEKVGVSRGSVSGIARGDVETRAPRAEEEPLDSGPIERCPTCGGTVYIPCRLCRTRDWKVEREDRRQKADQRSSASEAKLRPDDRSREWAGRDQRAAPGSERAW